jgi:hypothetical protein
MSTIINVSILYRAHSSGWGNPYTKSFSSLEKASAYLIEQFNEYRAEKNYPEEWEADDMFTDSTMKNSAPAPTEEMAKTLFSVDALRKFLEDKYRWHNIIYGPFSDYEQQIPVEFTVYETTLD